MSPKTKRKIARILVYFLLTAGSILCLLSLFWMIRSSLMTNVEIFMVPIRWLPEVFQWKNYRDCIHLLSETV